MGSQAIYDHVYRLRGAATAQRKSVGKHAEPANRAIQAALDDVDRKQSENVTAARRHFREAREIDAAE